MQTSGASSFLLSTAVIPFAVDVPPLPRAQSRRPSDGPITLIPATVIGLKIERAPFQVVRLVIDDLGVDNSPAHWIINDICVDGRSQFIYSGDVPGDLFAAEALDTFVRFEPCSGGSIELYVTYLGFAEAGAAFTGRLEGTVGGNEGNLPPANLRVQITLNDKLVTTVVVACDYRPLGDA